ncbi:PEP-CTERM sorting domain-containing protein [Pseudoduganella plicata]|uniref:Ice-binding protein C-terminal domain-containing protein n=1 Tax=Pseudoduganella plicata TaxID=321984 RepID=A0AA87Y5V6_9BURK|nr:PEP-CTERM sorting domain-containing protein [Pseudoduganella plicata]GGZ02658.1 hypothetical protein GCM10007388_40350 [Pseudoduganella plicata]
MKKLLTTLLIGGLLTVGSAARAATTIDSSSFSLTWLTGVSTGGNFNMKLLSDTDGRTQIGLSLGLQSYSVESDGPSGSANSDTAFHQLAGSVRQGYRITSMTFSAVANGTLYREMPTWPCVYEPGEATNNASMDMALTQGGERTEFGGTRVHDVIGQQAMTANAGVPVDGDFLLDLSTRSGAWAFGTETITYSDDWQYIYWLDSTASIGVTDYLLTVQVAPVPEPSTYAMLLAGLGVAGWAARRRKA